MGQLEVTGLSIAPALGEALAAWIIDGAPPIDLMPLSVSRFGTGPWPDDELKKQAAWQSVISSAQDNAIIDAFLNGRVGGERLSARH